LPYLTTYAALGLSPPHLPLSSTESGTTLGACQAFKAYLITNGGSPANFTYASIDTSTPPSTYCIIKNSTNTLTTANTPILNVSLGGGSTISCTDNALGLYSANTNLVTPSPYLPRGTSGTDSVGAMNARATAVSLFKSSNATILSKVKQGAVMTFVCTWLADC
jgi:hypothetical protein